MEIEHQVEHPTWIQRNSWFLVVALTIALVMVIMIWTASASNLPVCWTGGCL